MKYNDKSIMTAIKYILETYLQDNYKECLHWTESLRIMIEDIDKNTDAMGREIKK
jgi:hypothetical protein